MGLSSDELDMFIVMAHATEACRKDELHLRTSEFKTRLAKRE